MNKILVLFAILLAAHAIHLECTEKVSEIDLPPGTVNLIADNGQFLRVCQNCGSINNADTASVQPDTGDDTVVWALEEIQGGKVAFRGSNGKYLSRCNQCWVGGSYPDSAFVHALNSTHPISQWAPLIHPNGKYSFKCDNGKYLARCEGCNKSPASPNFAFIHLTDPSNPLAQWDVVYTDLPKPGAVRIKGDIGFLRLCPTCGGSSPTAVSM